MSADLALIRSKEPGVIDLAVGEPRFLQEAYRPFYPRMFDGQVEYPPFGGDQDLLRLLSTNADSYTAMFGRYVVICNGAKQALLAAIYALKAKYPDRYGVLTHKAPYWLSYPTMAEMSGLGFLPIAGDDQMDEMFMKVTTSPNNPDGSLDYSKCKYEIWDAAYYSGSYGCDMPHPKAQVSIWSAAKLWGLSGYRIGWLATEDPILASFASEYVEKTTSGVSTLAQRYLYNFLANLNASSSFKVGEAQLKAFDTLAENADRFLDVCDYFDEIRGAPALEGGMFAWCRAKDPKVLTQKLNAARVKFVPGKLCGADDTWFRFNMGVSTETMEEAVKALRKK